MASKTRASISTRRSFITPPPGEATKDFAVIIALGHNLSSYISFTTPDGREGWAQQVAQAGYEVYVINDSKFDIAIFFSTNTP